MTYRSVCSLLLLVASSSLMGQSKDAYLKVKANTGRTGVFVDGKYLGPAANFRFARKYAVSPGKHEIRLSEPRFEEVTTTQEFQAGKTVVVTQVLKPVAPAKGPFGLLRVKHADKYAAVYINDKFYGHAGEFNNAMQGIKLPAGEYAVRVEPVSGSPIKQKVKIEANQSFILK
jgi:hypothetical protein